MTKRQAERFVREARMLLTAVPENAEPPNQYGDVAVYQDDDGNVMASLYIGSFMAVDPCGRYHHLLSPNGISRPCVSFWGAVERWSDRLGISIESGDGDPTDIFAVRVIR